MAAAARSEALRRAWRRLGPEQRGIAVASTVLIATTLGPFSFVEAAMILVGLAALGLLWARAEDRPFHLPFGDGAVLVAGGGWCALLVLTRLLDRPLGQNVLALACCSVLVVAGLRLHQRGEPEGPDEPAVAPEGWFEEGRGDGDG